MLSCCCFCSGKFPLPHTEHLSSPPLLSSLPSESSCLFPLYAFALSALYRFFFKSLLSSQRSRTSLVIQGFFLRRFFPSIALAAIYVHPMNQFLKFPSWPQIPYVPCSSECVLPTSDFLDLCYTMFILITYVPVSNSRRGHC